MAKKSIFLGNGENDTYLRGGKVLGPGTVEVDEEDYDDLLLCVQRVQLNRPDDQKIDTGAVGTPPPIPVTEASVEQLQAMLTLKKREAGLSQDDGADEAQQAADRKVDDANRAAQQATDRLEQAQRDAEDAAATAKRLQTQIDEMNKAAATAKTAAASATAPTEAATAAAAPNTPAPTTATPPAK